MEPLTVKLPAIKTRKQGFRNRSWTTRHVYYTAKLGNKIATGLTRAQAIRNLLATN